MKIKIVLFFISLLILSSCKKDENNSEDINTPNIVLDFFKDNLNDAKQITTLDITSGAWTYGNKGTYIYISPCSFLDSDGNEVTGEIEFELIEAQTNLDMLKLNRQTLTSDGQLLVSGGVLYVNASKNGQALTINPNCGLQANMPNQAFNSMDGNMQYFSGDVDEDGIFGWDLEEEDSVTVGQNWDDSGQNYGFSFQIDSVGWINCDYFYDTQSELTGVEIELPNGYDGSNSQCNIYYNTINSVATLYDGGTYDGIFTLGPSYSTPVGMDVKFIAISGDTLDNYYYHITGNTTVTTNHYEIITSMTGPVSQADLNSILTSNL
jgi:hypothetical protein